MRRGCARRRNRAVARERSWGASQTWPPFVLVGALLAVGVIVHREGLFDAAAEALSRIPGSATSLLMWLLGLVALVTVVMNLDTSAAFLTPVLVLAARRRGVDERAFLYGAFFMSNAASLLLPGSNLTNLIVLGHEHTSGVTFAARMLPAWIPAVLVTAVFVAFVHRRSLGAEATPHPTPTAHSATRLGVVIFIVTSLLVVVLPAPALPLAILATATALLAVRRRGIRSRDVVEAVDPLALIGLFGIAVALGTVARSWNGPAQLMANTNRGATTLIGAVTAVAFNNLPAAVLLSSATPPHPRALLLGLNLGPNLAVTGSLSALVWFRAARAVGADPDPRRVSRLGAVLVPLSIAAASVALVLFVPTRP